MNRITLHGSAPYALLAELERMSLRAPPPLAQWQPPLKGDIDITIARDGNWYHEGSPMTRARLVRLFSTILRREETGDYVLVTPVEKWRIAVEDVPFQAILLQASGEGTAQVLEFTTNVHDRVTADAAHSLHMAAAPHLDAPSPCVRVRDGLEARLVRSVYYQLMELAVQREIEGATWMGVWSSGIFFPLGRYTEDS